MTKVERLEIANDILQMIASYGRKFFLHKGEVGQFSLSANGHIYFKDAWTKALIYTSYRSGRWKGFTEGGTLRQLICALADYISKEKPLQPHWFGPFPESLCEGDLWGYGKDQMLLLRRDLSKYITFPEGSL